MIGSIMNRKHSPKKSQSNSAPHLNKPGPKIEVVYRPLAELKLDPNNPRLHSPRHIEQLRRSIETFDFNVPILVDAKLKVIAGHGRILACQSLGWTEAPTIRLDHLTEAQARAFMIADNRLTEISLWDDRLLAQQLKELSELDLDFSLEATGFQMGEIDLGSKDSQPSRKTTETPPMRCRPPELDRR